MSLQDLFTQKLTLLQGELLPESSLLIVSKTRTIEEIKAYYQLGHRDFGENRVQELTDKALALKDQCPEIRWHMIGHLQSNKVNALFKVPNLYAIHSVHDLALAQKLVKAQDQLTRPLQLFLQYNTSMEQEKSGFEDFADLKAAAELILNSPKLKLAGLMTMGTLRTENFEAEALRCFHDLNQIKEKLEDELQLKLQTSMGMSQDYKLALQEKSNWIRLGTMMFV